MNYEVTKDGTAIFEKVKIGDVFGTEDGYYIKIDKNSAFSIDGDVTVPFSYCTVVKVCDAQILIEE